MDESEDVLPPTENGAEPRSDAEEDDVNDDNVPEIEPAPARCNLRPNWERTCSSKSQMCSSCKTVCLRASRNAQSKIGQSRKLLRQFLTARSGHDACAARGSRGSHDQRLQSGGPKLHFGFHHDTDDSKKLEQRSKGRLQSSLCARSSCSCIMIRT